MDAVKPSFFRSLMRQMLSSPTAVKGGYAFDLHGRWRYHDSSPVPLKSVKACPPHLAEILSMVRQ